MAFMRYKGTWWLADSSDAHSSHFPRLDLCPENGMDSKWGYYTLLGGTDLIT